MRKSEVTDFLETKMAGYLSRYATNQHAKHIVDKHYVGLRCHIDKAPVCDVSEEMGITESAVYKIYNKWMCLLESGDVMCKIILDAYAKKTHQIPKPFRVVRVDEMRVKRNDDSLKARTNKPSKLTMFNAWWTPEEEAKARQMAHEGELYIKKYDAFRVPPRLKGEYYTPGTNPFMGESRWFTCTEAAEYCGCDPMEIERAALNKEIQVRKCFWNHDKDGKPLRYEEYLAEDVHAYSKKIKEGLLKKKHYAHR